MNHPGDPQDGNQVRWLDERQQASWRAFIMGQELLIQALDRELREEHDISFNEYEVLVRLSEQPGRRMRMANLADSTGHSRSRMTHTIARMERAAWVRRESAKTDGRGVVAVMTEAGEQLLVAAAPTHVRGVREHLIDLVTPEDFAAVGRVFDTVTDALSSYLPEGTDIR